jgi:CheY-like chemotaxis protein
MRFMNEATFAPRKRLVNPQHPMKREMLVLHVEDDPLDAELIARAFEGADYNVAWTRVETEAAYVSALDSLPHAVIADYTLPQFSGLRALEILTRAQPDVPFILVSGTLVVMTMVDDRSSMTVVSSMISLAHSLRMKVVAEGWRRRSRPRCCTCCNAIRCRDTSSASPCLSNRSRC